MRRGQLKENRDGRYHSVGGRDQGRPPRGATLAATRPRLWQEIVTQRLERPRSLSLNDS